MQASHVSGMANRVLWSLIRSQTHLRTLLDMTEAVLSQPFISFAPLAFRAQLFSHPLLQQSALTLGLCGLCWVLRMRV